MKESNKNTNKDTDSDTLKYTKRCILLVGKKKQYRDILEACRTPASLGQIHFNLTKKMGKTTLIKAIKRLIRGRLLVRSTEYFSVWQPPLYQITPISERLLEVVPTGNKRTVQYIIGGDI